MVKDRKLKDNNDDNEEVRDGDEVVVDSRCLNSWAMKRIRSKAFFSTVSAIVAVAEESGDALLLSSAVPLLEGLTKEMKQPDWVSTVIRKSAKLPLMDFRVRMIALGKRIHPELLIPEGVVRQERKKSRMT